MALSGKDSRMTNNPTTISMLASRLGSVDKFARASFCKSYLSAGISRAKISREDSQYARAKMARSLEGRLQ